MTHITCRQRPAYNQEITREIADDWEEEGFLASYIPLTEPAEISEFTGPSIPTLAEERFHYV
jgi:hypothetical protein